MEKKRITRRLIYVLEEEFNMIDALSLPTKNPEDVEIRFFANDTEYRLKINEKKGKRK